MSDVKTERDGSVGIITKAEIATARRQAQALVSQAEGVRDAATDAEASAAGAAAGIHKGADAAAELPDGAEEHAAPPLADVDVWGVDPNTGAPMPQPGRRPVSPGSPGWTPLSPPPGGRLIVDQDGAMQVVVPPVPGKPAGAAGGSGGAGGGAGLPARARLPLPSLYPGTRRRTPGRLPEALPPWWANPVGTAGRLVGGGARALPRMALAAMFAKTAEFFIKAPSVAKQYDDEIARQLASLGLATPSNDVMRWELDDNKNVSGVPFGTRWNRLEGDNVISFRQRMGAVRNAFQMTGDEYLAMTRELGPLAVRSDVVTNTAYNAREYGLAPARMAQMQRTFMEHSDVGLGLARSQSDLGRPVGHYMEFAGMRDRPEAFVESAEAFVKTMSDGQVTAGSGAALGYTAWLGSIGLGNRRDIGQRLLSGTSRGGDDIVSALRMRAVREFLPKRGARWALGASGMSLNPDSLWDVQLATETKDPRLLPAYARFAKQYARERGSINPEQEAKQVFSRLADVSPAITEKVWGHLGALDHPEALAKTPEKAETWTQGPYHDAGGFEGKTPGAAAAAMDERQHSLGHGMNFLLNTVNEAITVAIQGIQMGRGAWAAITDGLYTLDPNLVALGAVAATLEGDTSKAVLLTGVNVSRAAVHMNRNIGSYAKSQMSTPGLPNMGATPVYQGLDYRQGPALPALVPGEPYRGPTGGKGGTPLNMVDVLHLAQSKGVPETDMLAAIVAANEDARRVNSAIVMHSLYNQAGGRSFERLWHAATGDRDTTGPQNTTDRANYATTKLPSEDHVMRLLQTARMVRMQREQGIDPTGGVVQFMHPEAMRRGRAKDPKKYKTPEEKHADWTARGLELVDIPDAEQTATDPVSFYRRAPKTK